MRNTKALIAGAFSQLLEEKPYRRITVPYAFRNIFQWMV